MDILGKERGDIIFQQDNAPCHSALKVQNWFKENNINTMEWPANSPDLNCIENLWSWLDQMLARRRIFNKDDLIATIKHHLKCTIKYSP